MSSKAKQRETDGNETEVYEYAERNRQAVLPFIHDVNSRTVGLQRCGTHVALF